MYAQLNYEEKKGIVVFFVIEEYKKNKKKQTGVVPFDKIGVSQFVPVLLHKWEIPF